MPTEENKTNRKPVDDGHIELLEQTDTCVRRLVMLIAGE